MNPMKKLNILCFGDSLTAGFVHRGIPDHSYASSLKKYLEEKSPHLSIAVDIQGQGGDQVISPPGQYLPRIKKLYQGNHCIRPYDYAIILGGTNDICCNGVARDIWPALEEVYSIPLSHATKVLSLSVPEFGYDFLKMEAERKSLNFSIMSHHAENFHKFDLSKAIPYWNISKEERSLLWQDMLHFTERGYDRVGALVAERLAEIMTAYEKSAESKDQVGKDDLK